MTTFTFGITYRGVTGGRTGPLTAPIAGTTDDPLYQTERFGTFAYRIPVVNGSYRVTLHFAEIFWTEAGKRVFDVHVEGAQVIDDLDIWSQAGKDNVHLVIVWPVNVTDGVLDIAFTTVLDNAKVSAIEVVSGN